MTPIHSLRTDAEFERLVPPLTRSEHELLEASLKKEGCREPLVVWAGQDIILDGHNRWAICKLHEIPFHTVDVDLPDRESARNWVIGRQFSRRNLSAAGASYLRGKRYLAEKGKWGGDHVSESSGASGQIVHLLCQNSKARRTTESRLAEEFRINARTIRRDAEFAAAVDALVQSCGEAARAQILSGDARLTRQQVARLAQLPAAKQQQQFQEFQKLGRWPTVPRPAKHTLCLDAEPAILARALWDHLGPHQAGLVYHHLATLFRG